uniref:NADH-cytochrome b5 reductase n=1 Tax=Panagrolaimus sp. JU765 TaxID=591449 RepID=A0AC34RJ87_9BILA
MGLRPKNVFLKSKNDEPKKIRLIHKEALTHDVRLFRWEFENDLHFGLLPGEHIKLISEVNGVKMSRFYSPVSDPNQFGSFEIVVKVYNPSTDHPNVGVFSTYLDSLPLNSELLVSGPFGGIAYLNEGDFLMKQTNVRQFKTIAMIAGGSGLTPMVQLMRHVMREDGANAPKLNLIYTNKTEEDVILADELKAYSSMNPTKFSLTLAFTRLFDGIAEDSRRSWKQHVGRIDEGLLAKVFPFPTDDVLVLICGPRAMNVHAKNLCTSLGYTHISIF